MNVPSGSSFIKSSKWLRFKNAKLNAQNNKGRCFKDALVFTQDQEEIKSHPKRIPNIKPFVNKYN